MKKIKYSVPRAAALLACVFLGVLLQQSCSQEDNIGSNFDDESFIEKLSNYE
jgi:hypothetical protein